MSSNVCRRSRETVGGRTGKNGEVDAAPPRQVSTPSEQLRVMRRFSSQIGFDEKDSFHQLRRESMVGPLGAIPVLTPRHSADAPRWYPEFAMESLSALYDSFAIWPKLLTPVDRTSVAASPTRSRFDWRWLRFDLRPDRKETVIGRHSLDTILAACLMHPALIRLILSQRRYIRIPYLVVGGDKRADFPVLFQVDGTAILQMRSRVLHLDKLRGCTFSVDR